ncbi:hypothetical protein [Neptunicoccus cionae]|uniref:Sulfotransferase family protein n=1 Tax=Neptunicoccus cionae TaxID=2035344 RepID=A0A916QSC6_9RHOB|nr:hypothetical protein [Amylibacter cionae]GGA07139.1 hypothetical protein GCM10011498_03750 [Amylibacter cionae]
MIKNLVIHIGDPKNGSSSIQDAVARGLWKCEAKTIAQSHFRNEVGLAKSVRRKASIEMREKRFSALSEWALNTEADYGVVSSEFFSQVRPEIFKEVLTEYLPEFVENMRILAYVRPHADRFVSTYAQRVKNGMFVRDMAPLLNTLSTDSALNYHSRFSDWKDSFGERLTVRPFIRDALNDNDVVSDFFHFVLEGTPFALRDPGITNRSLNVSQIAAMRVFREL